MSWYIGNQIWIITICSLRLLWSNIFSNVGRQIGRWSTQPCNVLTCRNDVKDTGDGLTSELIVAPAEQSPVIHFRLWLVASDADGAVDDDVFRRDGGHLTGRVELPAEKRIDTGVALWCLLSGICKIPVYPYRISSITYIWVRGWRKVNSWKNCCSKLLIFYFDY